MKKGHTNNPNGRPKGKPNKITGKVRELIALFVESKFEQVTENFDKLEPLEQWKILKDLLPYAAPKLQATTLDLGFDAMTDEQLDHIIESLKQAANEQE